MQLGFEQVSTVAEARQISNVWLQQHLADARFVAGFPERDDRIGRWRIPVMLKLAERDTLRGPVGELTLDWLTGQVCTHTEVELFHARAARLTAAQQACQMGKSG